MRTPGDESPRDCGEPYPCKWHDFTDDMREAFRLLMSMPNEMRGRVLCWFCDGCCRYVGPGDYCTCQRDE